MADHTSNLDFLRRVPFFTDLPEADLQHLCETSEEVPLPAREQLFAEGSLGDKAYIVKEGEIEVVKVSSGRDVLLSVLGPGEVCGEMALLEDRPRTASVRARTDSLLIAIHKEEFDYLLRTSLSAVTAMFNTLLSRWRATEAMLRQSEKMAQLGTLTAGVAHELNNPAAAVRRGADQLQEAMVRLGQAQAELSLLVLDEPQRETLKALADHAQKQAGRPPELDALARSDREYEIESWLEEQDVDDAWELAPALASLDYDATGLSSLAESFTTEQLRPVIGWLNATYEVHNLLAEISQGAGRISDIVKALKSYSYLDQAPVQEVDIHEGLDNTLLILRSKLKSGISVRREYAPDLPRIQAYGSELNQVWTNIIDNAADALNGQGAITIRTHRNGDRVAVEIEDNGPGIPPEIQSRIFDPFFTTKPPGHGTGLGLDISYNIVVYKHKGDITVDSQPGKTIFTISLPVNFDAK